MKKYSQSELFNMCMHGDVKKICEEFYNEVFKETDLTPMHSGDRFIMNTLRNIQNKLIKNENAHVSIVIINKDIPCLVVHRENDKVHDSIFEIRFPFQGEEINQIIYKVYNVYNILQVLSYDDSRNNYGKPIHYILMAMEVIHTIIYINKKRGDISPLFFAYKNKMRQTS